MKIRIIGLLLLISLIAKTQTLAPIVKLPDLQKIIDTTSEQIQVINFWATWCGPCIKELPLFERINESRQDVKVTLVSLDMDLDPNPEKVHKFVQRKGIKSFVIILDERDPNLWINKIEKKWEGSLPATLVVNTKTGKRQFTGKELQDGELEKMINAVK